jgi:hypothetical protein
VEVQENLASAEDHERERKRNDVIEQAEQQQPCEHVALWKFEQAQAAG